MQRFKNILVVYSQQVGGETVLDRAAALARRNHARLTLLDVFESFPAHALIAAGGSLADERQREQRFIDERKKHLSRLTASMRHGGIDADVAVRQGPIFLEIIREVLERDHDLVILAADGWRGIRAMTFGSNSMHVMRKCPCPVWVIKPETGPRFERILAAVNPGLADDDPDPLNLKIMQMASSLARIEECELDVVKAWDFEGRDVDTSRSEITGEIKNGLIEKNTLAHRASLTPLLNSVDLQGIEYEVLLPQGDPRFAIPEIVQQRKIDLIVMGTVTRTGIAGLLIGSTAEDILHQVDCSVLTVKPDGFRTPVKIDN